MALRHSIRLCSGACLALASISPAAAEPLSDESTGLAINPPEGYIARTIAPTPTFVVRFEVKKPTDRDTGCQVVFTPLPQNAELKQSEINDIIEGKRWIDLARATIGINYDVSATDRFGINGIGGIAMVGDFKPRPACRRGRRTSEPSSCWSKRRRGERRRFASARSRISMRAGPSLNRLRARPRRRAAAATRIFPKSACHQLQ